MSTSAAPASGSKDASLTRRRLFAQLAACGLGAFATARRLFAGGGQPMFVLKPDPPQAGKDLEVTYLGENLDDVGFRVGKGKFVPVKPGPDGKFTISKVHLEPGELLTIEDQSEGDKVQKRVTK